MKLYITKNKDDAKKLFHMELIKKLKI